MRQEQNVAVTVAAAASCFKRRLKRSIQCHVFAQSLLGLAFECFNAVLFGSNGNSYTVCTQSDVCIYAHVLRSIETLVGENNYKKDREICE